MKETYTYMHVDIYVQKRQKKEQISKPEKKGSQFLTLSKMDNQRAHTEADGEVEGGQFGGKVSPPSPN